MSLSIETWSIIRDRIQDMIKKGLTLQQIKTARPTRDYDPRYGATTVAWTTDMFIEAVYRTVPRPAGLQQRRTNGQ